MKIIFLLSLFAVLQTRGRSEVQVPAIEHKSANLNEWLSQNAPDSVSLDSILVAASHTLNENESKMDSAEKETWRKFVSLDRIKAADICSYRSAVVLNEVADYFEIDRKSNVEPKSRAKQLVYKYLVKHAKDCEQIYQQTYKERRRTFDQSEYIMVSALAYNLRTVRNFVGIFRPGSDETEAFLSGVESLSEKKMAKVVAEVIKKNYAFEQKETYKAEIMHKVNHEPVNRDAVGSLVRSVFDKCVSYVELFTDCFEPALFDAGTNIKEERYGGEQLTNGLLNYLVCRNFLFDRNVEPMIDAVIPYIPKRLPKHLREKKAKSNSDELRIRAFENAEEES